MATQGRRPARGASKGAAARRGKAAATQRGSAPKGGKKSAKVVFDAPAPAPEQPRTFRLGAVAGATPGKWIDAWKQRLPHVPLELISIDIARQRTAIDELDAALVRLPLNGAGVGDDTVHTIALYDEVPVVVASIDSHLLAADELTIADLAGEVLIALSDDPLAGFDVPSTRPASFASLSAKDAVATAASGVGIVIVPMSLARVHQRKDADYRVLTDGPVSTIALSWKRERTTPDVETFVGIVRGRTANSSR